MGTHFTRVGALARETKLTEPSTPSLSLREWESLSRIEGVGEFHSRIEGVGTHITRVGANASLVLRLMCEHGETSDMKVV